MKLYRYFIILITFLIIFPLSVKSATVVLSCPALGVNTASSFKCNIIGQGIDNVTMKLELPSGFDFVSTSAGVGYQITGSGVNLGYKKINTNVLDTIGTLNIKAPSVNETTKYSISLTDIKANDNISLPSSVKNINVLAKTTTTTKAPVTDNEYVVTLNPNNGEDDQALSCTSAINSCNIDLSSVDVPLKSGYTFKGWGSEATCQSGDTSDYTVTKNITLYACYTLSNQNEGLSLKSLIIEGQVLEFSKFKYDYELKVLYEVEELNILAEPSLENTKVTVSDTKNLVVGENLITISLSDATASSEYKIKVIRLNEGEQITEPSSDATLKTIRIAGYKFLFNSTETNYELKVKYKTTSLSLSAETTDPKATYIIENTENIKEGTIVKISVTAEDGTTSIYKITIKIETVLEHYLIYIVGTLAFILVVILYIVISIKKKQKKEKPKNPKKDSKATNTLESVEVLDI